MPLLPFSIAGARRIPVRLVGSPVTHPTAGYRDWFGRVEANEPIVGLVAILSGSRISWARTSHRASNAAETRILFAPYDEIGCRIQICFGMMDATAYSMSTVDSVTFHPAPQPAEFAT